MDSEVVVVDISSDEEDCGVDRPGGGLDWLQRLIDVDDGDEGEGGSDDLFVFDEPSAPAAKRKKGSNSPGGNRGGVAAGDDGGDDDCLILEVDPDGPADTADGAAGGIDDDDLVIVAEKGQVACRDYPHSRHLCANFPFDITAHKDHCRLCHCYVCDSLAPCKYWGDGSSLTDHCNSTEKDGRWKSVRQSFKRNNMASSQSQKLLDNIRLPCQNQVFSSTPNARSNVFLLQPISGINTANLGGSMIQGHYPSPSIFSHRSTPGLYPAISHQPSVGTQFLQKEHCIVNAPRSTISYFRTRYKRRGTSHAGYSSLNTNQHHSMHSINKHMQNNVLQNASAAAVASQRHLHHEVRLQKSQNSLGGSANVCMGQISSTQSGSYSVPSTMQRSQYESAIDGAKSWQEILASVASDLGVSSSTSKNITDTEQPVPISVQSAPFTQEHPHTNTNQNITFCGQTVPAVRESTMVQELQNSNQGENLQQSSDHLLDVNTNGLNSDLGETHLDSILYAMEQELLSL